MNLNPFKKSDDVRTVAEKAYDKRYKKIENEVFNQIDLYSKRGYFEIKINFENDDDSIYETLAGLLKEKGYTVHLYTSGIRRFYVSWL